MATDPNPAKVRTTLYFTAENHKVFAEICKREGIAMGQKIEDAFLNKYVQDHKPGNPQQKLEIVTLLGHSYHAETCQKCGNKPVMYGKQGNLWLGFCAAHWDSKRFMSIISAKDRERRLKK